MGKLRKNTAGYATEIVIHDTKKEKSFRERQQRANNPETLARMEIHDLILAGIAKNENKNQIAEKLNSIKKYEPYKQYFEGWINDQIAKKEKELKRQLAKKAKESER